MPQQLDHVAIAALSFLELDMEENLSLTLYSNFEDLYSDLQPFF